jgi:Uma2 family endonuclease
MTEAALLPRPTAREATRHPISMDEVLAMQAAGAFAGVRTQLLDGEVHVMPSDGVAHIGHTIEITAALIQALKPRGYRIAMQTTLHLTKWNGPSPDIYVLSPGPLETETDPARILLVIEVAVTSLKDDLTDAASRYARHGVQDYWVVDVEGRQTHVHRAPHEGVYPAPVIVPFTDDLRPLAIPDFALRIADLATG